MKVLIIGSGGREHALGVAVSKSIDCEKLYFSPGNAGTEQIGINVKIFENEEILQFCLGFDIDLVIIGPENYLVEGLSDYLRSINVAVFGPSKEAARIESEKMFAKEMMYKANIPTAFYKSFNSSEYDNASEFLKLSTYPIVLKANGLAAGKGVAVCSNFEEANSFLHSIFIEKVFGDSGSSILVEEFLEGEEASIFAITDGTDFILLPAAQDHKRIGEGDTGKNTGGMGAYCPAKVVTKDILRQAEENIIRPLLLTMKNEGNPFTGCLYCGLMINKGIAKVVEFNCRFGDPETQSVLPLLEGDVLKLLHSSAIGKLDFESVRYDGGCSVTVMAVSKGYPDAYKKGYEITGLKSTRKKEITYYHSGTTKTCDKVVTNGGRVISSTSVISENNLQKAVKLAYEGIERIEFKGMYFRRDIGHRELKREPEK